MLKQEKAFVCVTTHEEGVTINSVRFYNWYENASQIRRFYSVVLQLAENEALGCDTTRAKLRTLLVTHAATLKLELALLGDAATDLVKACYSTEGDNFLACSLYD